MGKTIKIRDDLDEYLDDRRSPGQSYDGIIREEIGSEELLEAESRA